MRINATSRLTAGDVHAAAARACREFRQDIYVEELTTTPRGAIVFYCESCHGRYATNRGSNGTGRAASWTAWGYMIADLFQRDPSAKIGVYKGVEDFRARCEQEHEWHLKRRRHRKGEAGEDISFLKLLEKE